MPAQDLKNALDLLDSGRPHQAIAVLERLVDRMPGYTAAHTILARAYEAASEWDAARAAWEHARILMPNSPVVRAGLQRMRERATAQAAFSGGAPLLDLNAFDALLAGTFDDTPDDATAEVDQTSEIEVEDKPAGVDETDGPEDEDTIDFEALDAVLDDLDTTDRDLRAQAAAALAAAQAEDETLTDDDEALRDGEEPASGDELDAESATPTSIYEEIDQFIEERPHQEPLAPPEEPVQEPFHGVADPDEQPPEPEPDAVAPLDEPVEELPDEQPSEPPTDDEVVAGSDFVADEAVEETSDESFLEAADDEPVAEEHIEGPPPALTASYDEALAEPESEDPEAPAADDDDMLGLSEWEEFESEAEAAKSPAAAEQIDDLDRLIEELETARIVPAPELDDVPSIELDDDIDDVVSETLARIYASQQQYEEAARVYEQLARQQPDQADQFLQKAAEMNARAGGSK